MPDWARVHTELRRPGVNLGPALAKYAGTNRKGLQVQLVLRSTTGVMASLTVVMLREATAPDEEVFVEYAGKRCR